MSVVTVSLSRSLSSHASSIENVAAAQDDGPLDDILQLANIAGPRVSLAEL